MRLYLVSRTDFVDWDEHFGVVVAARDAEDVNALIWEHSMYDSEDVGRVRLYGFTDNNYSVREIAKRTSEQRGIVLDSFLAG